MFDGSEKLVGKGAQADVFLYDGFAYKKYKDSYPIEWIDFEIRVQSEINRTKLKTVKYYKTENPLITKMDFIDGVSLLKYYEHSADELLIKLVSLQAEIHKEKDVKIPRFNEFYKEFYLEKINCEKRFKSLSEKCLTAIPDEDCLCHLDFHPLNIMVCHNEFYIIDWINARIGNPIYDYARTYLLLCEKNQELSRKYKELVSKNIFIKNFDKAFFVVALQRTMEDDSDFLRKQIAKYYMLLTKG